MSREPMAIQRLDLIRSDEIRKYGNPPQRILVSETMFDQYKSELQEVYRRAPRTDDKSILYYKDCIVQPMSSLNHYDYIIEAGQPVHGD